MFFESKAKRENDNLCAKGGLIIIKSFNLWH